VDMGAVEAATPFVVLNANDSGVGSLRQVLAETNGVAGPDTVTFDPTFFATAKTITLTSGAIPVTDSVSVLGPGASIVTVSGNNASQIFQMNGSSPIAVLLTGLTITQGNNPGPDFGGAIHAFNVNLTIQQSVITANQANLVGGIAVDLGSLTMTDCQV